MEPAQSVEWMAGASFLMWGLSCFLRAEAWNQWLEELERRGQSAAVVLGSILVILGSFIVYFHPVWHGLVAVFTVLGGLCFLEGSIYLIFPHMLGKWLRWAASWRRPFIRLCGLIFTVLAILLLGLAYSDQGGMADFRR